jgi:hypothetical protein
MVGNNIHACTRLGSGWVRVLPMGKNTCPWVKIRVHTRIAIPTARLGTIPFIFSFLPDHQN